MTAVTPQNKWVEDLSPNSVVGATEVIVSPNSGGALLTASRTSDAPQAGSMGCQGSMNLVENNCSTVAMSTYAAYDETYAAPGKHPDGTVQGRELAIINQTGVNAPVVDPYNQDPLGLIEGDRLGIGKSGNSGTVSALLQMVNVENSALAKAWAGIVFGANSLVNGLAIAFGKGHKMQWYSGAGKPTSYIRGDGTNPSSALNIIFNENGVYIQNAQGINTHLFSQDALGNGHILVRQNGNWKQVV